VEIISDAAKRLQSLTSDDHNTVEPTSDISGDFEIFSVSFVETELYGDLLCKILLRDSLMELVLQHLTDCCHPELAECPKTLRKPAKAVARVLLDLAESLAISCLPENKHRVKICERYGESFAVLFADLERRGGFSGSADFLDVMSAFVPLMSSSLLVQLMKLLLRSPNDSVEVQFCEVHCSFIKRLMYHFLRKC